MKVHTLKRLIACLALVLGFGVAGHVTQAAAFGGCVGYEYHPTSPPGAYQGAGGYCSSLNAGESYQIQTWCGVYGSGNYYSHFGPRVFTALVQSNYLCGAGLVDGGYILHEYP